jgi:hypothetical protein
VTLRRSLAVLVIGALGSQAGHLLAYTVRFGAAAGQVQSSGAHAYFPFFAKTSLGIVASALLGGLFLVGLARILSGRRAVSAGTGPSYIALVAALFTIQLVCFAGQEIAEAALVGAPTGSAAHLLLWGTLGQLPVAAVAALAVRWLAARLEAAVEDIRCAMALAFHGAPHPVAGLVPVTPDLALLLSSVAGPSLGKRSPPLLLAI